MWNVICALLTTALVSCSAEIGTYDYDNKIEENSPGDRDNLTSNVYVLPEQIFNDGKPFYVKKDPVSGTINFNAKTTPESLPPQLTITNVQAQTTSQSSQSNTNSSDNEILVNNSNRTPDINLDNTVKIQNFHDYLPVKYQSSKFVYPLVSSSYANLKYQGSNKNYISNHKYETSTVKLVSYVTKKPKINYPNKAYTIPIELSSSSLASTSVSVHSSTIEYETVTKSSTSTTSTTRKYANIPSRAATPGHRYTTLSRPSSTTMVRNTNANYENKFNRFRSTTTSTTTQESSSPSYNKISELLPTTVSSITTQFIPLNSANHFENQNKTTTPNDKDSMNLGDLFNYFFENDNNNNADSKEAESIAEPNTTQTVPASSTTQTIFISSTPSTIASFSNENGNISNGKNNITLDSSARKPYNRTTNPVKYNESKIDFISNQVVSHSTTATSLIAEVDNKLQNIDKFRPPTSVNNVRVSPSAQNVAFLTNGQVSTAFGDVIHSSQNIYPGQFQPPSQGSMSNIVVLPNSDSASFVASSQLQTANRFDQKRPIANANKIDETTKSGITFITKGQVTSAEVHDNKANLRAPQTNLNNVVIASGAQTPNFITSNQSNTIKKGNVQQNSTESRLDQPISPFENEIGLYGQGILSTQRPQGFILASTTAIPKAVSTVIAQSVNIKEEPNQHVRFPNENSGGTAVELKGTPKFQQIDSLAQQPNTTVKFPTNKMPPQIPIMQQALPNEGLVSFNDGSIPNQNFVVFRQPVMMNMHSPPQMIRNTPFVFKKPTFVHYPRKNFTTLPNILPQFRPSTQPQSISLEMANKIRQSQLIRPFLYGSQNMRYKTPPQFRYGQRLPIGAITIRPVDPSPNRRHFELHPGNSNQRFHDRTVLPLMMQRNVLNVNPLPVEPQRSESNLRIIATNGNEAIKGPDFDNADSKYLDQPMLDTKKENSKVEPVTTLQMIHQQRLVHKGQMHSIHGAPTSVPSQSVLANPNATDLSKTDKPLYLVYPMHKEMHRPNGEIQNDRIHRPSTIQQLELPYAFEKTKTRYVLNSRPVFDAEKKSDQSEVVASNDNDEEDR